MESGEQIASSPGKQKEILLKTKLFVPTLQPNWVNRSRLMNRMSSGMDKALILVSAPAGHGKTTLVSSWLRDTAILSSWLSLDEDDNDPIIFLQYFITALQKIAPTISLDILGLFQGIQPASFNAVLNILINEIAGRTAPFALVLDDFHTIHAQPVLEMITYLLDHMPPQMHLVLLSRIDPPLPLSHLRARNQLLDIRADQLRFTRDEITYFLNEVIGLKLSIDDIAAMEARTEGWIAGLQLAAISMQSIADVHLFVSAFTGSHAYIMDYLTEEVLKQQPEKVRLFLLQTSILGSMCGALCEAVVEPDAIEYSDGQSMLEDLEHKNLFLIPLDNERHWYRYHHLFADVLNRRLEHQYPYQSRELHQRASQWYEQNGFISESIQQAIMAGDQHHAAQLIEQNGVRLLIRGEATTLLKWIEAVQPQAQEHTWFYIFKAWALALTGNLDQVNGNLRIAEELISMLEPSQAVHMMQGAIAAARAHQAILLGEGQPAADFARQALKSLQDIDPISKSLRTVAISLLGDASSMSGNLQEAKQAYLEAALIGQAVGDIHLSIVANSQLADILVELGSLHQASKVYLETLQIATRPDGQLPVIAGRVCAEISQVFYEWNQLDDASQYLQQSLVLCQQWGNMGWLAEGYGMLARFEQAMHHPEKAQEAMRSAEQLTNAYTLTPKHAIRVRTNLARLWIAQGDLEKAYNYVKSCGITADPIFNHSPRQEGEIPYLHEPEFLTLLRLLLARGDYGAALALSQRLILLAEAAKRNGRLIEVLALQALALQGMKDLSQALTVLERAFSIAEPEGFVRLFLDEGEPMTKLLFQAKSHRAGRGYASTLLSALDKIPSTAPAHVQMLIEPLTTRELEVLSLIEDGCSNQDIAAKLFISIPTVKRHISNIYTKLGTSSRTQAISRGRELKLFG